MQMYTFESISATPINRYFTQLYVIINHCLSILIDIAYLIRLFSFSFLFQYLSINLSISLAIFWSVTWA